jgi:hypothetical protein
MGYAVNIERIAETLSRHNFTTVIPGIFTRPTSDDTFVWASIAGNNFILFPNIGAGSLEVNRLAQYAMNKAFGRAPSFSNIGVTPLFLAPLWSYVTEERRAMWTIGPRNPKRIDTVGAEALADSIITITDDLGSRLSTLEDIVDTTLSVAPGGQAQSYLVPAALSLLGRMEEFHKYASAVLETIQDAATKSAYDQYCTLLDRERPSSG